MDGHWTCHHHQLIENNDTNSAVIQIECKTQHSFQHNIKSNYSFARAMRTKIEMHKVWYNMWHCGMDHEKKH